MWRLFVYKSEIYLIIFLIFAQKFFLVKKTINNRNS